MKKHLNLLREFSVPLVAGVVVALFWANLDPAGYRAFDSTPFWGSLSFHFISNELFMTLFFGIAAVEITQSCMPGGDLNPISRAVNPLFGTLGGVLGPVLVYLGLNALVGLPELRNGWGIPTATDIALAWLAARMVFGPGHPAVSYLLLLAVADDAIGLAIIALFYPDPNHPVVAAWLLLTLLGMLVAWGLGRRRVRSYWPYILLGGSLSWIGLHQAHLHPALALVFIIPFLPHRLRESRHLFDDDPGDRSPLAQFEHEWKVVVDFGLFLFGLANAGVEFSSIGTVTWLVLVSLLVGKTVGIFGFGLLAERLGFRRPRGMKRRDLLVAGVVAGTGFTVALFVSGSAFSDPVIQAAAKMGAMFSLAAALIGMLLGQLLRIRKVH
ncbi:Na+/H+ antiporter NhaA [Pelobacter propionicus]|uniref:Na(+)/H(+) antiporter NhaA 2 n=1 Tax=Pelobacter propionicus (strain DSM 2379 / NBRC 103807 / OttBd1) TaxID=338966 RepID=NHAA2_PELPD|nr:Na+/H+ antiporter NhaA [Pelobacter propionicus]A1ATB4.1 RecName: Full=Na(+)/H(+) antiporter NhaA 2; AltName: Full=Sodium/proton antiporter NhaA 2 [Pelobacter propionicus DSM 2379]ABL00585.1 sodium/proton antiporter, NhaA family [Pelobacter propionicus DSM 2379]